ncbi:ras-associated and pleckstrin homology domains-containing protein 1-like [Anopheles maculipalpis]|uniref:ras-associated and pleckstrin homology domains-containing protein 1-like n=1 Tax=Anopheles maculipalpis TaxID=1496333 RepID=UPI002159923A|nr:ras-associated and pleckstrin homology domains-containing protein 1-like [Anopheles maculipalpis]
MKITFGLVLTVALVASLCSASPLLVTKHVVKRLVAKHQQPKTVTHAVVYTPVVAPTPHVVAHSPSLHAKLASTLGALLKNPLLQHPWLAKFTPGGVVEVYRKHVPAPAPYPAAVPAPVLDLPHEVEEHHTVTTVVTPPPPPPPPAPAPTPAPVVVPAPVYGVPAPTYGLPSTSEHSSASSSSASSSSSATASSGVKYVAVNPGARHEAPLPGYDHSVVFENLEPAPGTEGLTMLVPPVVSNELNNWNAEPVVLRGQDLLSSDYLRMANVPTGVDGTVDGEAKYVAINNGVRHEAPLPGYDHSIVIENLDTV